MNIKQFLIWLALAAVSSAESPSFRSMRFEEIIKVCDLVGDEIELKSEQPAKWILNISVDDSDGPKYHHAIDLPNLEKNAGFFLITSDFSDAAKTNRRAWCIAGLSVGNKKYWKRLDFPAGFAVTKRYSSVQSLPFFEFTLNDGYKMPHSKKTIKVLIKVEKPLPIINRKDQLQDKK